MPLSEGETIRSVTDLTGNGNALSVYTGQSNQNPLFTMRALNGRGGFWPGNVPPGAGTSPTGGGFQSPPIPLSGNGASVLFCAQFGGVGNSDAANLGTFAGITFNVRSMNGKWPRDFLAYDYSNGRGITNFGYDVGGSFCGPVAGAFVISAGDLQVMLNRYRASKSGGFNWYASSQNVPQQLSSGNNCPYDCIWHEVALYDRALTPAELDVWQVYCNEMYLTPLARPTDSSIDRRVIFVGGSLTEGQNSTYCRTMPNLVAAALGNWDHVEYINYGVGSATSTQLVTKGTTYDAMLDPTLGAGHNVLAVTIGLNDLNAGGTPPTIWSNIQSFCRARQAAGWKVVLGTNLSSSSLFSNSEQNRKILNAMILNDAAGWSTCASAVVDVTPTDSYFRTNQPQHPDDTGYAIWAGLVAPAVSSML